MMDLQSGFVQVMEIPWHQETIHIEPAALLIIHRHLHNVFDGTDCNGRMKNSDRIC